MSHRPAKRILMLTSSYPRWSGDFAGCFVAEFAQTLSQYFEITVLVPSSRGDQPIPGKVKVHRFNYFWPVRLQQLDAGLDLQPLLQNSWWACIQVIPLMLMFCWQTLRLANQADLICAHWLVPGGLVAAVVAQLKHKPLVVIEHSGAMHLLTNLPLGRYLARFIAQQASQIVVVSQHLKSRWQALCPQVSTPILVIPMGIDCAFFTPQSQRTNSSTILFLGRLTSIKGVDLLIKALAGLANVSLIVAGDGPQREELIDLAQQYQLDAQFVGAVDAPQKRKLLQVATLVVMPSRILSDQRTEGTPIVCLEAFASHKAVIATPAGGLAELIEHETSGLLVPLEDTKALQAAICRLLTDDRLRDRLGQQAAQVAQMYDWQTIGTQYYQVLIECLFPTKV